MNRQNKQSNPIHDIEEDLNEIIQTTDGNHQTIIENRPKIVLDEFDKR